MKLVRNVFLFSTIFTLLFNYSAKAQSFGSNVINVSKEDSISSNSRFTKANSTFKPRVKLNLGTSFSSFGIGNNAFGTYVAPEMSMPVSKKIEISVGISYSNIFYQTAGDNSFANTNTNYGSIYVSGTYHVNEKLSVRATGYKTFLLNPSNFNSENQNSYLDFSSQGAILDFQYNVSDHFSISASFQYHEQKNPNYFYGNPYGGGYGGFNGFSSPANFNGGFAPGF